MTHRTMTLLCAGLAALTTPPAGAQQDWEPVRAERRQAMQEAREFRDVVVPGDAVASGTRTLLRELRWHGTLSGALQSAQSKRKPVVWIQALGDLDGFL